MTNDKRPIIMYHGSLAELNSRNPGEQYEFAKEADYLSPNMPYSNWHTELERVIRNTTRYDGIVNRRTSFIGSDIASMLVRVEGTPIVRAKKD